MARTCEEISPLVNFTIKDFANSFYKFKTELENLGISWYCNEKKTGECIFEVQFFSDEFHVHFFDHKNDFNTPEDLKKLFCMLKTIKN